MAAETLAGAPARIRRWRRSTSCPATTSAAKPAATGSWGRSLPRARHITIGRLRQSRLKCPPEEAALQRRAIATLHVVERAELGKDTLTLYGPDGEASRFVPRVE